MKTDTSMNFMLVIFCLVLIALVVLNNKMSDAFNAKQAAYEREIYNSRQNH